MAEVKNKAIIEVKREDRLHTYECPANGSLGEIFDCLYEMRGWVLAKMNEAHEAEKKKQEEQPVEPKVEVIDG